MAMLIAIAMSALLSTAQGHATTPPGPSEIVISHVHLPGQAQVKTSHQHASIHDQMPEMAGSRSGSPLAALASLILWQLTSDPAALRRSAQVPLQPPKHSV